MLEGLLELQELNLYGNKVSVIVVPHNPKVLAKLETLNLGYNDLAYIPEELDRLKALRILKVMNNFLEKIPMRVCDMELKSIDVSSNPVIQPPIETCERGIGSMKRYYQCLRMEEQNKQKALEALQNKAASRKSGGSLMFMGKKKAAVMDKVMSFTKPKRPSQPQTTRRKSSDESNASSSKDDRTAATTGSGHSLTGGGLGQRSVSMTGGPHKLGSTELDAKRKSKSASALVDDFKRSTSLDPPPINKASDSKLPAAPISGPASVYPPKTTSGDLPGAVSSAASVATAFPSIPDDAQTVTSTETPKDYHDEVTVNDTLKVIFVGMAMAGKTSMIKRLIQGNDAVIPKRDERTVGVDIYEWDTKLDRRFEHIDSRIELQDKELEEQCGDVNVKFSVWDFAGQHVYHATHELFFSPRALYVLVWDMGATNPATKQRKSGEYETTQGAFKLSYDSDCDSSEDDDFASEEEARRADRALERDIDDKVQFWVDCIQSSAPGAAILPVASFDDLFSDNNSHEAKRRCNILKQRLLKHEARRLQGIKDRLKEYNDTNRANDEGAMRLRKLLCSYTRPKLIFGKDDENSVVRVSGTRYTGFATLTERIINIATGRDKGQWRYPIFRGHVGARIPRMRLEVREAVRRMRDRFKVVEWGYFINQLRENNGLVGAEDISDALLFLTNIGELSYFGGVLPDRERLMSPMGDSGVSHYTFFLFCHSIAFASWFMLVCQVVLAKRFFKGRRTRRQLCNK
jgi:GTPase SAR1 family protein